MKLLDLFDPDVRSKPLWGDDYKIPWHEPEFSRRMLEEHLSQDHDLASRRQNLISEHVTWIHEAILNGKSSRVLDLGCGPGFYSERLATMGHTCRGIDISPASIDYAGQSSRHTDRCDYILGNILDVDFGTEFDLVLLIYGEFNVFPRPDADVILEKSLAALKSDGQVLIEPHTFTAVKQTGATGNSWYASVRGLFSDQPHICLISNHWHEPEYVAESRYTVIDATSAEAVRYRNLLQGYTNEDYLGMLQSAGFRDTHVIPPWGNAEFSSEDNFIMLHARK
jgi:SAM-dependent methyltransferase